MNNLQVETQDAKYLERYENWFDRATTNILLKETRHLGLSSQDTQLWTGSIDGEVIAVALFYIDEMHDGHLDFAVKPSERRQGIGTELMSRVLAEPLLKNSSKIQVEVATENTAGQKILQKNGFVRIGYTPEGLLEFIKR